jgi:DNA-binding response OmpR family regulator
MKKILVVDDNEDTIDMVEALLSGEDFEVETATDGMEALSLLDKDKQAGALPDLVILDMFMPEMSGREVCEKMRSDDTLKSMKVIFFTAADFSEKGRLTLDKLNVSDYIAKPFHNADFLARIKSALDK